VASTKRRSADNRPVRSRPKIATTVARETFAAIGRFSEDRSAGWIVDEMAWIAIRERLAALWAKIADGRHARDAVTSLSPGMDRALARVLYREVKRIKPLAADEVDRLRVELKGAHGARIAVGRLSTLDDFVRLFVATRLARREGESES